MSDTDFWDWALRKASPFLAADRCPNCKHGAMMIAYTGIGVSHEMRCASCGYREPLQDTTDAPIVYDAHNRP
jgi:uncharacterized protein (DUF983 family)